MCNKEDRLKKRKLSNIFHNRLGIFAERQKIYMKYTELIPNVKWNCLPNNNRNILILSHPQQTTYYLSQLKDYIWKQFTNITIWQTNLVIDDWNQLLKEVEQMDAVICFVTELLVSTRNEIGDILLPIIIERKYPLLPLVASEELEQIFDKRYGHIHFVKCRGKYLMGYDAIDAFLKRLPLCEEKRNSWFEISQREIEYFSQSYFLSYRKVDGKYIEELQYKIHSEPALIDTQLWYDSYLSFGENYDQNLAAVIEKSSAVILIITPHLLEPDNYVSRIEIPFAKECGKIVIGIMLEETDLKAIWDMYGINKIYKLEEWDSFTDILLDAGVPIPKVDSYSAHLYGLAVAYMDGEYVECNMRIACELLYQAIQIKHFAAYEKLIEIKSGEYEVNRMRQKDFEMSFPLLADYQKKIKANSNFGDNKDEKLIQFCEIGKANECEVPEKSYKDISEAIRLFDEYVNILTERYESNPSERLLVQLLDWLRKYGEFYINQHMFKEAVKQLLIFYKVVEPLKKQGPNKLFTYLSVASLLLAKTYVQLEDYDMAERYYKKSISIDRMLNDDMSTHNSITYTNYLTSLCEFGNFCQKRDKLLTGKIVYQEVLQTIQNNRTMFSVYWDMDRVYNGYDDENSARKTEELERFARISLWEIETKFLKMGKYRPTAKIYPRKFITDPQILKCCNEEEIQLLSHEIMINSIEKIKWLTDFVTKSKLEFDICQNHYCMDAKNIMAVMTLDIDEPCQLVVHTIDKDRAFEILHEIVDKLND